MSRLIPPAVIALALLAPGPASAGPVGFDHLKCFDIRDRAVPNQTLTALLTPEQAPFAAQRCRVRLRAQSYCVDVEKQNVRFASTGEQYQTLPIGGAPTRDYACYKLRCEQEFPRAGLPLEVEDQFGRRTIFVKKADFVCAPGRMLAL